MYFTTGMSSILCSIPAVFLQIGILTAPAPLGCLVEAAERWQSDGILATVPIANDRSFLSIPVSIGGEPHTFALDTGSTHTTLDNGHIGALKRSGRSGNVRTARGSQIDIVKYIAPEIKIEQMVCRGPMDVNCLDLGPLERGMGIELDGILGMDVLKQYVVHFDFDNGIAMFLDPALAARPPGTLVNMELDATDFPCIFGQAGDGNNTVFRLDTGLTGTGGFDAALFESLKAAGETTGTGFSVLTVEADGAKLSKEQGRCLRFAISGLVYNNLVLSCGRRNVLGLAFLARHRVTFDFTRGKMYLDPGKTFAFRDRTDYEGVGIRSGESGRKLVVKVVPKSIADTAGMRVGDEVLEINGKEARTIPLLLLNRMLSLSREDNLVFKVKRGLNAETIVFPGG